MGQAPPLTVPHPPHPPTPTPPAQFFTGGMLLGLIGFLQYLACVNAEDGEGPASAKHGHACHDAGPGVQEGYFWAVLDLVLNTVLVWATFALLPLSEKKGVVRLKVDDLPSGTGPGSAAAALADAAEDPSGKTGKTRKNLACFCCGPEVSKDRGGRLRPLLWYDMCALGVAAAAFAVACYFTGTDAAWRVQTNLFFARVVWGLLSFPFFLLSLPVVGKMLTHAEPTGFDAAGQCVPMKMKTKAELEEEAGKFGDLQMRSVSPGRGDEGSGKKVAGIV